jgi:hypothetical protein
LLKGRTMRNRTSSPWTTPLRMLTRTRRTIS